jgi:hypothetical protein
LKQLQEDNARLKWLVAELSLEKQVLRDVAQGNFQAPSGGVVLAGNTGSRSGTPAGGWGKREGHNDTLRSCGATRMP